MGKKVLGKGLGALFDNVGMDDESAINEIKLTDIEPNRAQPRKNFDEEKLELLSESIKIHGVIQPIIVKKLETGFYQIIAGERRWRAARLAGLKAIPAVVKDYSQKEIMEIALIENLQREDLNPIEESEGYKKLMDEFSLTQEEISARVGKSRSAIANALRLLNLSDEVKKLLTENKISTGHARAILAVDGIALQKEVALKVISDQLSVRQTEKYVKNILITQAQKSVLKQENKNSHYFIDIENTLSQSLGTKVKILSGKKKGRIEIEYYSNDDLERLLKLLPH